jgi:hypothetical protein
MNFHGSIDNRARDIIKSHHILSALRVLRASACVLWFWLRSWEIRGGLIHAEARRRGGGKIVNNSVKPFDESRPIDDRARDIIKSHHILSPLRVLRASACLLGFPAIFFRRPGFAKWGAPSTAN